MKILAALDALAAFAFSVASVLALASVAAAAACPAAVAIFALEVASELALASVAAALACPAEVALDCAFDAETVAPAKFVLVAKSPGVESGPEVIVILPFIVKLAPSNEIYSPLVPTSSNLGVVLSIPIIKPAVD